MSRAHVLMRVLIRAKKNLTVPRYIYTVSLDTQIRSPSGGQIKNI